MHFLVSIGWENAFCLITLRLRPHQHVDTPIAIDALFYPERAGLHDICGRAGSDRNLTSDRDSTVEQASAYN